MFESLSVRRAADRERMADELDAALQEQGATTSRIDVRGSREITLQVAAPGGAFCSVYFIGTSSMPCIWVVTWNSPRRMAPGSWDVNPYHGCKATRVLRSFADLCSVLVADVARFADGSAFLSAEGAS